MQRYAQRALFPYTTLFRSLRRPGWDFVSLRSFIRPCDMPGPREKNSESRRYSTSSGPSRTRREPSTKSRSEEHTSELQSRLHLVCRLLLEKKKKHQYM